MRAFRMVSAVSGAGVGSPQVHYIPTPFPGEPAFEPTPAPLDQLFAESFSSRVLPGHPD